MSHPFGFHAGSTWCLSICSDTHPELRLGIDLGHTGSTPAVT